MCLKNIKLKVGFQQESKDLKKVWEKRHHPQNQHRSNVCSLGQQLEDTRKDLKEELEDVIREKHLVLNPDQQLQFVLLRRN